MMDTLIIRDKQDTVSGCFGVIRCQLAGDTGIVVLDDGYVNGKGYSIYGFRLLLGQAQPAGWGYWYKF